MSKFRINRRQIDKLFNQLEELPSAVMDEGGKYFKDITPVRSGNARNNTSTNTKAKNPVIKAKYGYAARLDEGWSKQAPQGMSKPTEDKLDQFVNDYIRNIK